MKRSFLLAATFFAAGAPHAQTLRFDTDAAERPPVGYEIAYSRHPYAADVVDVPHKRTDYLAALINHFGSP